MRARVAGLLFLVAACGHAAANAPKTDPAALGSNAVAIDSIARTALVVIDLQTRIVDQPTAPRSGREVVRQAARLADAFRR